MRVLTPAVGVGPSVAAIAMALVASLSAQTPVPIERLSFQQAVDRAIRSNPSVTTAAAGILRAEGLLRDARSATRLQVTGNVITTTLNSGVSFNGSTVNPQNQVSASVTADMPIVAAAAWARRAQAAESVQVAELNAADVRRQVAIATADAYLSILAARRVVEANVRASDTAKAHYDLASQLEQRGSGSRLNVLRAQQQWSIDQGLAEAAALAVYRAQEALGVLVVAPGPVDATDEPAFNLPPDAAAAAAQSGELGPSLLPYRADLKLFTGEVQLAQRVVQDSSKDWWPSLDAIFLPQSVYPAGFFSTANSWRFLLQGNIPIFDSGQRSGLKVQRQAALDVSQATLAGAITTASSEVRAAREGVASGGRILASAQASSDQAQQVLDIVNISFRAGAATNIEVIDAQRVARDAANAVAIAEDSLRRSQLDLLAALGRFP